ENPNTFLHFTQIKLIDMKHSPQVVAVCLRIHLPGVCQFTLLVCREGNLNLPGDITDYRTVHGQGPSYIFVVFLCPHMPLPGEDFDQLQLNSYAVASSVNRTFYDGVNTQFTRNVGK